MRLACRRHAAGRLSGGAVVTDADKAFRFLIAQVDDALSANDRTIMAMIERRGMPATLDHLCSWVPHLPRPVVFYTVARLEDLGYLPKADIR